MESYVLQYADKRFLALSNGFPRPVLDWRDAQHWSSGRAADTFRRSSELDGLNKLAIVKLNIEVTVVAEVGAHFYHQ